MFASVPEASVHKDGEAVFGKEKVGPTQNIGDMQFPAANSGPDESRAQNSLGTPIAFAADRRHNPRTSGSDSHKLAVLQLRF